MKLSINEKHGYTDLSSDTKTVSDWYALRLLSNYRLLLLICITALFYLPANPTVLGQSNTNLFHATLISYLIAGVIFNHLIRIKRPGHDTQFYFQAYIDIVCITLFTYASGGIQSGLEILLVANIAIIGIFTIARYTFLFAAIATMAIMAQEVYTNLLLKQTDTSLIKTGFAGISLFAVAYITSVVIQKRFPNQADRDQLLENVDRVQELNQRIIQQMDSGIIVVDAKWRIQLINDSAIILLGLSEIAQNTHLSKLGQELTLAFSSWRASPYAGTTAFRNPGSGTDILPHFSRLGNNRTLISIEDYSLVAQQVQQLKLASLGRLSASIAHEIRNPLGAISNSVQLVLENEALAANDKHLLTIAERHCWRINRIIEDILQLSRRKKNNPELIDLNEYLPAFCSRFAEQHQHAFAKLTYQGHLAANIRFDKSHLEQILLGLCVNAIAHNYNKKDLEIEITSRLSKDQEVTSIEVCDNGFGVKNEIIDEIFEPFTTSDQKGTGLGLFITRELCEINNATISLIPQKSGACFKIQIGSVSV